jgi:hypothetical protein
MRCCWSACASKHSGIMMCGWERQSLQSLPKLAVRSKSSDWLAHHDMSCTLAERADVVLAPTITRDGFCGAGLDPPRADERRSSELSQRSDHLPWACWTRGTPLLERARPPTFLRQPRKVGAGEGGRGQYEPLNDVGQQGHQTHQTDVSVRADRSRLGTELPRSRHRRPR